MKLQPNIGSDRSWVYKVAADYAETPATSETLAIRFANSDSQSHLHVTANVYSNLYFLDANQFKTAFESAQANNAGISGSADSTKPADDEPTKDEPTVAPSEPQVVSKVDDVSVTQAEAGASADAPAAEEKKAEEEKEA